MELLTQSIMFKPLFFILIDSVLLMSMTTIFIKEVFVNGWNRYCKSRRVC
ncbi:Hypothetical protein LCUFL03_150019 [Latilactobacillus curvatus]|nr:Hypothetical protein LCUFL03_150019 [Latilactobacillus curvatus]